MRARGLLAVEMGPTYAQAYRKSWESIPDLKDWLRPVEKDKTKAYCVYCKCEITAKLSDLRRHTSSVKHVRAAEPFFLVRGKGEYHFHMKVIANANQLVKQKDDWLW